ncbi:hypothetical protein D9619_013613 [Psilocybe cf. subviscida]|uniref:F-box domain-containing protein n=1 Tax=Psilocybe cf. subviscida TaxID=2480587 RepID=A0A8H5BTJ8_9AGAR|nr:hypothetical protein D9619_013613 [Psilocybe cf. subviscida]
MGSRVSRLSDPSSISGPPRLPFEIFLEVLSHLRTSLVEDRKTLLALALCCRALRDASQKNLFNSMLDGCLTFDSIRLARNLKVHSKFLGAIMGSPNRLALFVLSYTQQRLALDPKLYSTAKQRKLAHIGNHIHVWTLTAKALPLMVNLKNFDFTPLVEHPSTPKIFRKCTFQLESLNWGGYGSEKVLYTSFLPTQRSLMHLNINAETYNEPDGSPLPDGFCPSLVSVAFSLPDLARISARRAIVALHVIKSPVDMGRPPHTDLMSHYERERCIAAMKGIQKLRIRELAQFHRSTNGITFHNVTLLQLGVWNPQDISLLGQFPNLRYLRLWDSHLCDAESSIHHDTAVRLFAQAPCPELQSVLIVTNVSHCWVDLVWEFSLWYGGVINAELASVDDYIDSMWWRI